MEKAEVVELVGKPYKGINNTIWFCLGSSFFATAGIISVYRGFLNSQIYNEATFFYFIADNAIAILLAVTFLISLGIMFYNALHLDKIEIYQDKMKLKSLFDEPRIIYFKEINSWHEWDDTQGDIDDPHDRLYLLNKSQQLLYCLRAGTYENYSELKSRLIYNKRKRKTPYNIPSDFTGKPIQRVIVILLGILWVSLGIGRYSIGLGGIEELVTYLAFSLCPLIYGLFS